MLSDSASAGCGSSSSGSQGDDEEDPSTEIIAGSFIGTCSECSYELVDLQQLGKEKSFKGGVNVHS